MISAKFNPNSNYAIAPGLWQYDYGQILQVSGTGITENVEIHFSTQEQGGEALVLIATYDDETDTLNAHIPGEFLTETYTEDYRIYAFIYVNNGESGETIYKIILPIKSRPKPEDYDDTGDEAFNQSLADAVQQVNNAKESARTYAEEIQQSVSTAVQSAENASQSAINASQSANSAQQSAKTAQAIADSLPSDYDDLVYRVETVEQTITNKADKTVATQSTNGLMSSADKLKLDGLDNGVGDVQINGTSIVSNGVAKIPIANGSNVYGVVRQKCDKGIIIDSSGQVSINSAILVHIKNSAHGYRPITPTHQHESVFYGLAKVAGHDEKNSTLPAGQYTEEAKSAISDMLNGAVQVSGTTPTIAALSGVRYVCGEVATLEITPCASGICDIVFTSGSTATVLTLPNTVKFPDGAFTPEANTTYELNIMDGVYGAVMAWT